jgi:hypothetical protein
LAGLKLVLQFNEGLIGPVETPRKDRRCSHSPMRGFWLARWVIARGIEAHVIQRARGDPGDGRNRGFGHRCPSF